MGGKAGRAAVHKNATGLARVLGAGAPALLDLVRDRVPGADALLFQMLYFLTGDNHAVIRAQQSSARLVKALFL